MIPANTRTITPYHGNWKRADGMELIATPEINNSYIIAAVSKSRLKKQASLWLVYLEDNNGIRDYDTGNEIEGIRLCYGTITEITYSTDSGRKRREITFLVAHVIRLVDVPSILPAQPFPSGLANKIDDHLTGMTYFGGCGHVERNGDYYFLTSEIHGIDEQVVALKYNNEVHILLSIQCNEWNRTIIWRTIGNYIPKEKFVEFLEHDKNNEL
ncbi:hypothetical protein HHL17_06250 [Chitinophaga sp. G-6-1-13]|uniref:Uncharacterized protein n=1 Tax=Chitinophaga fulva TaxID=2728842 RepID=A0A848GE72_9BACT|nr:hypothetical protein [Chitinophaga fulva]NML36794.1 hypothetical protein [Chitinophaga fulva]